MLVLFTEQDLISFGNFMVSKERAKPYFENEIIKNEVEKYLSQVNKFDFDSWIRMRQEEELAALTKNVAKEEKPKAIDEVPVEEEENVFSDDNRQP